MRDLIKSLRLVPRHLPLHKGGFEIRPINKNLPLRFHKKVNAVDGWTLSEDGMTLTKEYTKNTTETVHLVDLDGMTKDVVIEITNIENKKEETQVLAVLGNHEFIDYRDVDATVGYDVYRKYVNEDVDTDIVINGYHFIGVSYDDNGSTFSGKTEWLDERLAKATEEDPDKPIFVYQHPHPTLTVYGSVNWGDMDTRVVLSKYPQVVNFSGHSHYAASDPRSVWQGEFT